MFAQSGQLFHRHVAAGDGPLIILLQHERPDEPDDGLAVGEGTDDIGAPLDLLVDAFQGVGAVQLGSVANLSVPSGWLICQRSQMVGRGLSA